MQSNLPWIIYAHKIQHNGGSGESMFKYYLNAINKERAMETCMTCRGNGQNNLRLTAQALNKNRLGIGNAEHVTPKSRHHRYRAQDTD